MFGFTLEECRLAVLFMLLIGAVFVDLRERRIPNALVLMGLAAGLAMALWAWDITQMLDFLAGVGLGLLAFLPLYLLRWVGAGDVKLLAVIGGFVGFPAVLWVVLFALLAGGMLAWLQIAYVERVLPSPYRVLAIAWAAAVKSAKPTGGEAGGLRLSEYPPLPYSLALALGVVFWMLVTVGSG